MCSGPLQNYLTSLLERNQEFKELSKDERADVLQKAYELLDRRIDEKIREKNLKIPTIAAAKELINIVCQEQISSIEKMMI
ncbi:hypothetical protein [Vibrio mimicus]